MAGSCCEQVAKAVPLASSLQIFKEDSDFNVIGYHCHDFFSIKLPHDLGDVVRPPIECYSQVVTIEAEIVLIFKWSEKYWILDCEGALHQISANQVDADSADLFDDAPENEVYCCAKKVRELSVTNVLSASFVPPNFIAVLSYRKDKLDILVTIHQLDTAETLQSLVVNQRLMCRPNRLFVEYVDSSLIAKEFISNWFPNFNQTDSTRGYLFIHNCDESICCVQLASECLSICFFFSWPSPCIFSSFRRYSVREESLQRNLLVLSFEDGAVIGLSFSGGEILHFTMNQTKCVSHAHDLILSSDYTDCLVTPLDSSKASCILPLKGVISFCLFDEQQARVLALTNYGGLYIVKADVEPPEGKCHIPEVSSFQERVNNIEYLEELNSRIAAQDRSIKCLATAVNSKNFRFKLDIQVVQVMAEHHLFRVTCESLESVGRTSPVLRAEDWHIVFILSSSDHDRLINIQQLPNDFTKIHPLEVMVRLNLENHDSRDHVALVKLISFVGEGKYRPSLVIGKVRLNVLSFLEPPYSLLIHAASSSFKQPSVIDLLRTQYLDPPSSHSSTNEAHNLNISIEIPTLGLSSSQIIEKFLDSSKALWRVNSWELNQSSACVCIVVRNTKIFFSVGKDSVTVTCDSPDLVILIKYAVLNIVRGKHLNGLDEAILMETENILQSLDVMQFCHESTKYQEMFDIYKRKVQLINDSLVGASTTMR